MKVEQDITRKVLIVPTTVSQGQAHLLQTMGKYVNYGNLPACTEQCKEHLILNRQKGKKSGITEYRIERASIPAKDLPQLYPQMIRLKWEHIHVSHISIDSKLSQSSPVCPVGCLLFSH